MCLLRNSFYNLGRNFDSATLNSFETLSLRPPTRIFQRHFVQPVSNQIVGLMRPTVSANVSCKYDLEAFLSWSSVIYED